MGHFFAVLLIASVVFLFLPVGITLIYRFVRAKHLSTVSSRTKEEKQDDDPRLRLSRMRLLIALAKKPNGTTVDAIISRMFCEHRGEPSCLDCVKEQLDRLQEMCHLGYVEFGEGYKIGYALTRRGEKQIDEGKNSELFASLVEALDPLINLYHANVVRTEEPAPAPPKKSSDKKPDPKLMN